MTDKTVTFTETVQYETEGRGKGPIYKAGETHTFREDIADRWIRRNVAEVAIVAAPKLAERPAVTMAEGAKTLRGRKPA